MGSLFDFLLGKVIGQGKKQNVKILLISVCLFFIGCSRETKQGEQVYTPIPENPQVISNNSDIVIESWVYLSPRSDEALQAFPSPDSDTLAFGSDHYEAYIMWHEDGFDVIWGNFICSVQPILVISDSTIELWLNDSIWENCESAEAIHAFKVVLETNIRPEGWTYILYTGAPS